MYELVVCIKDQHTSIFCNSCKHLKHRKCNCLKLLRYIPDFKCDVLAVLYEPLRLSSLLFGDILVTCSQQQEVAIHVLKLVGRSLGSYYIYCLHVTPTIRLVVRYRVYTFVVFDKDSSSALSTRNDRGINM